MSEWRKQPGQSSLGHASEGEVFLGAGQVVSELVGVVFVFSGVLFFFFVKKPPTHHIVYTAAGLNISVVRRTLVVICFQCNGTWNGLILSTGVR